MTDIVTIRLLEKQDFPLLFRWLNEAHLYPFYRKTPISHRSLTQKYLPRLQSDHPVHCLVAAVDDRPFGYLQWYFNRDVPDYGRDIIAEPNGVSLDFFIGDPGFLGKGYGPRMLRAALTSIRRDLLNADRLCFAAHHRDNAAALRCSRRAGFEFRKDFVEDGQAHVLLVNDGRTNPE